MTAAEALAAADAEGLTLIRSRVSTSGYKYIYHEPMNIKTPFALKFEKRTMGNFVTAEEAALSYARKARRAARPEGRRTLA